MGKTRNYTTQPGGPADTPRPVRSFLPDFCRHESLLPVMLIGEALAIVLVAVQGAANWEERLSDFALVSLFIQWVALCDVAVLCALRSQLARLSGIAAATLGFLLLQTVTLLVTLGMGWIVDFTGLVLALPQDWFGMQLRQNLVISMVVTGVALRYFHVQYQLRQKLAAEAEARVRALQARIRPHFLFNSMNSIASLTRIDAEKAELAVQDLAELFRASLADRDRLSLDQELELTRSYLRMEKLRLGERLQQALTISTDVHDVSLPALTIQPLVENAVYHGIETLPEGGLVRIDVSEANGYVLIRIENPVGTDQQHRHGNRIAQENVRQRLAMAYQQDDLLRVEQEGRLYRVELRLPRPSVH